MNLKKLLILTLVAGGLFPAVAFAKEAAELTRLHLYDGSLAEGEKALEEMTAQHPDDAEAWYGLGMIRFTLSIEHLGQGLYTHGLSQSPHFSMPILRLPVPENSNPEPLTPQAFNDILLRLESDLGKADAALAKVGDKPVHIDIDLKRVSLNFTGKAGQAASFWRVLVDINRNDLGIGEEPETFIIGFDEADAAWLDGYSHVLMATAGLLTAYDTSDMVTYGLAPFFAGSTPIYREMSDESNRVFDTFETDIGDLISFVHTLRFPLVDGAKLKTVKAHLHAVASTSRLTWKLVQAETDNNREWLPSPKQTGVIPGIGVSAMQIASWMSVLDTFDAVLDGKLLVPHWRFNNGVDFGAIFDHPPEVLDIMLTLTGPAIVPYLRDGPLAGADMDEIDQVFNGQFIGYAIWFN